MIQYIFDYDKWISGRSKILILSGPLYTDYNQFINTHFIGYNNIHVCHFDSILTYFRLDKSEYNHSYKNSLLFSSIDRMFIRNITEDSPVYGIHLPDNPYEDLNKLKLIYSTYYLFISRFIYCQSNKDKYILTGSDFYCIPDNGSNIYIDYGKIEYLKLFYKGKKAHLIRNNFVPYITDIMKEYKRMRTRHTALTNFIESRVRSNKEDHKHDLSIVSNDKIAYEYYHNK